MQDGNVYFSHNYGLNYGNVNKGHRANGFTTDGGFKQYAVNNINTLKKFQKVCQMKKQP